MGLELDGVNGILKNTTSDGDVTIKGNDGGSEVSALILDMSDAGTATFNHDVKLSDNSKAFFGTGNDLQIYHDGTNSYISDQGTNDLKILATDFQLKNTADNEFMMTAVTDGAVTLYHNNVVKIATTSAGVDITGGFNATVGSTITTADNTDTLTLVSTDADASSGPNLRMYRNNDSNADDDVLGVIEYEGRNDNSQDVRYVQLTSQANDITDGSEDGSYYISTMVAGALSNRINVRPTETIFNEESKDLDFRVESNGNANMLFVNGGTDRIGVGINDPVQALEVRGQIGISASGTGSKFLGFYSSDTLSSFIEKSGDNLTLYNVDAGNLTLATGDAERVRIHSNGVVSATAGVALGVGTANTASNVLDDYEEGTWTPTLSSNAAATAYSLQVGVYTKIGRMVHVSCQVQMSDLGSFAGATIQVNGLPFTSANNSVDSIAALHLNATAIATSPDVHIRIPANSAFARLENASGATTTDNNMNANRLDTGSRVRFTAVYSV